jgi:hypothetical protein
MYIIASCKDCSLGRGWEEAAPYPPTDWNPAHHYNYNDTFYISKGL